MSNQAQALTRDMGGSGAFSTSQMIIMLLLADHADEKWSCFPSVDLLMHHSQLKERTVRDSLKQLSEKGVLTVLQQRSQTTGAQLPNRYVLNEKAIGEYARMGKAKWEAIKAKKAAHKNQLRAGRSFTDSAPVGFVADGPSYGVFVETTPRGASPAPLQDPHVSAPASVAPLLTASDAPLQDPHVSAPASPAPLPVGVQETAGRGAGNCKNAQVPLKGTRADLTINHQSSIMRDSERTVVAGSSDVMMIDSNSSSPTAAVVAGSAAPDLQIDIQPTAHRGVIISDLVRLIPVSMQSVTPDRLCRVVDLVLNRAGAALIRNPTAYVARACHAAPEELLTASVTLSVVTGASDRPEALEEGVVAMCDSHDWCSPNPRAICPSCRADALCEPEPGEPCRPMPVAGEFRTDLRLSDQPEIPSDSRADALPWGPDEEPGF